MDYLTLACVATIIGIAVFVTLRRRKADRVELKGGYTPASKCIPPPPYPAPPPRPAPQPPRSSGVPFYPQGRKVGGRRVRVPVYTPKESEADELPSALRQFMFSQPTSDSPVEVSPPESVRDACEAPSTSESSSSCDSFGGGDSDGAGS